MSVLRRFLQTRFDLWRYLYKYLLRKIEKAKIKIVKRKKTIQGQNSLGG